MDPITYQMARGEIKRDSKTERKRKQKQAFLDQFGGVCFWCCKPLDTDTVTEDHLYPKSKGGLTVRSNLVPACATCNVTKANTDPEIFMMIILGV